MESSCCAFDVPEKPVSRRLLIAERHGRESPTEARSFLRQKGRVEPSSDQASVAFWDLYLMFVKSAALFFRVQMPGARLTRDAQPA